MLDLFIIGGGVNGTGIARDAAGRGLSVGLAEMGDLGSATSSASSKMFHGGLRYLEYYEFRLVREALSEREVLLEAMPHISWPMRFVLPHHKGLRLRWMVRLGLFLYDHLGGRKILPATRTLDLTTHPAGDILRDDFTCGFEYSDCWVDDARLVLLNALDARERGAEILTRTKLIAATRHADHWELTLEDQRNGRRFTRAAKRLVNAAGPWVKQVLDGPLGLDSPERIRLVRGSHIVVSRLTAHEQPYILQNADGRVIFVTPFAENTTLIGTTEADVQGGPGAAVCSDAEARYLCEQVSHYLKQPVTEADILWRFAGVRPLYDDGASSATAATREYVLRLDAAGGAPLLSVFGGKITTYRRLAEAALEKLGLGAPWTARVPLPGGDFPWDGAGDVQAALRRDYPFLTPDLAARLVRQYGTRAHDVLGGAKQAADLGRDFGGGLYEAELRYLRDTEFAESAEDVLWRRSKLGLRRTPEQVQAVENWFQGATA